jgi:hypothetical protein
VADGGVAQNAKVARQEEKQQQEEKRKEKKEKKAAKGTKSKGKGIKRKHSCTLPSPTVDDFFAFMVRRESLRLCKARWPNDRSLWTDDPILRIHKFTNVSREHDFTTACFRRVTEAQKPAWLAAGSQLAAAGQASEGVHSHAGGSAPVQSEVVNGEALTPVVLTAPHLPAPPQPLTPEQLKLSGLVVFNCCLMRQFGTAEAAAAIGFIGAEGDGDGVDGVVGWDPAAVAVRCRALWDTGTASLLTSLSSSLPLFQSFTLSLFLSSSLSLFLSYSWSALKCLP